ncbi:MCP four helix bundle domain-containing protein, partial [Thermodesulfobium sp. 4217-1]|uniref:MCP four helix bundle domain-containing protein n=1 Tax=Thermodesulfobium sp. 4217-1 TaxID=3120013 RepID=UPI003221F9E2
MEWFSNLKIGKKLLLSFILIAIISGIMGIFGVIALKNVSQNSNNMYGNMTVPLERLLRISVAFDRVKLNSSEMVNAQSPNEIQDRIAKIKQDSANIDSLSKEFSTMTNSDQMRNLFQEFQASWSNYKNQLDKEIALVQANRNAEATALLSQNGDLGKAGVSTDNLLTKMKDMKLTHAKDMADINNATANNSSILMVILMLITLFLAILLGIVISKIISNPLKKTQELINEMSKGHFSNRLRLTANDEIGQMARALDAFSDEMQKVFIGALNKIAEGDLSLQILQKDDKDEITPAIKKTVENINALLLETNNLIQAT